MLGIIGLILKIILWIILGLLSLVLLILLVVLFVPIRYRVDVNKPEDGDLTVLGRVTWLLSVVRIVFSFEGSATYKVKVLFFTVMDSEKPAKASKVPKVDKGQKKDIKGHKDLIEKEVSEDVEDKIDKTDHQQKGTIYKEKVENDEFVQSSNQQAAYDDGETTKDVDVKSEQEYIAKTTVADESKKTFERIKLESESGEVQLDKNSVDKTLKQTKIIEDHKADSKEKTKNGKKKKSKNKEKKPTNGKPPGIISKIKEGYGRYSPLWTEERYEGVLKFVLSNVLKIVKSILPKKLRANVIFGTGDPATTGYIVGGLSMFYGVIGNSINVTPEFHEKYFEGKIYAKGRVFLFVLLYYGIRTYLDKRVRAVIKLFKS